MSRPTIGHEIGNQLPSHRRQRQANVLVPYRIEDRGAVETTDACLGRVVETGERLGGVALITADHGNAEQLLEADGTSPHTAHTSNPVPLIVTDPEARLRDDGELSDLAPTVLAYLGLRKPLQMSGRNLCK